MAHIGIFCLPMPSHLALFLALAETLAGRGYRITMFGISENKSRIQEAGFEFQPTDPDSVPPGTLGQMIRKIGQVPPLAAMRLQGRIDELRYEAVLHKGAAAVKEVKLDGMIVDQAEACSGSIAEAAGLPWVGVASGLCMNAEPAVPPLLTPWSYSENLWCLVRNRVAYAGLELAAIKTKSIINRYRKRWGLPPLCLNNEAFSPFAQIAQQNREFDFPRHQLPKWFHYVGPIHAKSRHLVDFPWNRLNGRPMIYASLGTVNRHKNVFTAIAEACSDLHVQLVLSLGGGEDVPELTNLTGSPLIVRFAPQPDLLKRASLTITHGGLNTTLESLTNGVPLVAIPINFDQFGVAARIRWTGTGEFVKASGIRSEDLKSAVTKVLREPSYREHANKMRDAIARTGGSEQAADIITEVIRTRRPVLS
ncbi:MAG: MGT family glycosyltransferase [Acidobacteriaceae bacterium]|nr:MGT family glycosyltransferase [Acidobacteriaceae bacterium]MBV9501016.1 MGT family glycosyltransferase [Acidobacteriaceae bacterium]